MTKGQKDERIGLAVGYWYVHFFICAPSFLRCPAFSAQCPTPISILLSVNSLARLISFDRNEFFKGSPVSDIFIIFA